MPDESELCVRCVENKREKPFKKLPAVDYCWSCASEEEREAWWNFGGFNLIYTEFNWDKDWQDAFLKARSFMKDKGYPLEDQYTLNKWMFLYDLKGQNLTAKHYREKELSFANLENANLELVNLDNVNLKRANLQKAKLVCATFRSGSLLKANAREAKLDNVIFDKVELFETDFTGAKFNDAQLIDVNISNCNFKNSELFSANLSRSYLNSSIFENAYLVDAILSQAILYKAILKNADLTNARLEGANFYEAHLENSHLIHANLEATILYKAFLEGVELYASNFQASKGLHAKQFEKGIGDDLKNREEIYRELATYWRNQGYNEDEDWARIKMHRARILKLLEVEIPKDKLPAAEQGKWWSIKVFIKHYLFKCLPWKNRAKALWEFFMDFTSLHGTSVGRAAAWTFLIPFTFTFIYPKLCPDIAPKFHSFWDAFYFSVNIFTTLGIGPDTNLPLTKFLIILEVALGYTMLGVLVSVIARKMSR